MKKMLLAVIMISALISCSNYGKKVTIEGTKGEVYYKGDGVTEADAKKTGEFLKEQGFFDANKGASIQLSKENDVYIMRFVYDKDVYDTLKNVDQAFKIMAVHASKKLFNDKKVTIALANKSFKDYKTISFDESLAKELNNPEPQNSDLIANDGILTKEDFDHDVLGGINFYWKDMEDDESKKIADYIVNKGSFNGAPEMWMTKLNDRVILMYPLIPSARNDESVMSQIDVVARDIKQNLFPNSPFSFYAVDDNLRAVRKFDY